MVEVGRRLYSRGLIAGFEGNFCIRLDHHRLLATPSGVCKGHLTPDQLIVVDSQGRPLGEGVPSSEIRIHVRAMEKRPDCLATVHAHPPTATGFSVAGVAIPGNVMPESAIVLGPVAMCPFGYPGTTDLPDTLDPFLAEHKTFVLKNHGALTLGSDIFTACYRMESLEQVAKALLVARLLGQVEPMPQSDYDSRQAAWMNGSLA